MIIEEFIAARLDEDEQIARTAAESFVAEGRRADWREQWSGSLDVGDELHVLSDSTVTRHAERFDPARVLRECTALRRVVDAEIENLESFDGEFGDNHSAANIRAGQCTEGSGVLAESGVLLALAAIWSDHPDYQEGWAK